MYAIVNIAGKQFKVSKNDNIRVPKIQGEVGKSIEVGKVLLISDNGKVSVGKPELDGASIKAKIVGFERDKKVIVFKKKRRKGYRVKKGHRQDFTDLMIESIATGSKKKEAK